MLQGNDGSRLTAMFKCDIGFRSSRFAHRIEVETRASDKKKQTERFDIGPIDQESTYNTRNK